MKKLFVCLAMIVMMFAAGVTLSACGSNSVKIRVSVESASEPLVKIVLKQNDKEVEGRGYNYTVQKGSNFRVELVAKTYGVDFSDVVVKVNGSKRSIIRDRDYNCAYGSEHLVYGNFALADVDEKLEISVAGVKGKTIVYDFEVENIEDETAIENMQNAYIDAAGNGEYVNFYEFLTDPDSKIERSFLQENFNSFNLKVGNSEKGDDVFQFSGTNAFRIRVGEDKIYDATLTFTSDGYYTVSFPNIEDENYTIIVDFKDLVYRQYAVVSPKSNLNYSILCPEVLDYTTSGTVTVAKNMARKSLVYDDMRVYINDLELKLDEGCDLQNDDVLTYVIPDKITPFSTSLYGELVYTVRVDGISYADETYEVRLLDSFDEDQNSMMTAKLFLLDDDGERIGELTKDGGKYIVVKGEKVALFWQYNYDADRKCFVSKYELLDFDILIGDVRLVEPGEDKDGSDEDDDQQEEQEPEKDPDKEPEKEPEKDPEEDPEKDPDQKPEGPQYEIVATMLSLGRNIDKSLAEDQTVEIVEGYVLTAYYDEEMQGFSGMQLEFSCENDKEVSFGSFKNFTQNINVSFDFENESVTSVEVDMGNSDGENWTELNRGAGRIVNVEAGQFVTFRLAGTAFVDTSLFEIDGEAGVLEFVDVSTYNLEGTFYTELRYRVSNYQYTVMQNVKLVSTRG